ncbi:hypothetical protein COO60DRAFT_1467430 [Scenedesmus sp. NREL 46B-D3]|nr:hypothetical protein COO60DRAFT_1467430 [Scenedesmus sp. NREL 46B-D3]
MHVHKFIALAPARCSMLTTLRQAEKLGYHLYLYHLGEAPKYVHRGHWHPNASSSTPPRSQRCPRWPATSRPAAQHAPPSAWALQNFLYMLDSNGSPSYRPNPRLACALEVMFILHQEHKMNCSTAAARHLASRRQDRCPRFLPSGNARGHLDKASAEPDMLHELVVVYTACLRRGQMQYNRTPMQLARQFHTFVFAGLLLLNTLTFQVRNEELDLDLVTAEGLSVAYTFPMPMATARDGKVALFNTSNRLDRLHLQHRKAWLEAGGKHPIPQSTSGDVVLVVAVVLPLVHHKAFPSGGKAAWTRGRTTAITSTTSPAFCPTSSAWNEELDLDLVTSDGVLMGYTFAMPMATAGDGKIALFKRPTAWTACSTARHNWRLVASIPSHRALCAPAHRQHERGLSQSCQAAGGDLAAAASAATGLHVRLVTRNCRLSLILSLAKLLDPDARALPPSRVQLCGSREADVAAGKTFRGTTYLDKGQPLPAFKAVPDGLQQHFCNPDESPAGALGAREVVQLEKAGPCVVLRVDEEEPGIKRNRHPTAMRVADMAVGPSVPWMQQALASSSSQQEAVVGLQAGQPVRTDMQQRFGIVWRSRQGKRSAGGADQLLAKVDRLCVIDSKLVKTSPGSWHEAGADGGQRAAALEALVAAVLRVVLAGQAGLPPGLRLLEAEAQHPSAAAAAGSTFGRRLASVGGRMAGPI